MIRLIRFKNYSVCFLFVKNCTKIESNFNMPVLSDLYDVHHLSNNPIQPFHIFCNMFELTFWMAKCFTIVCLSLIWLREAGCRLGFSSYPEKHTGGVILEKILQLTDDTNRR